VFGSGQVWVCSGPVLRSVTLCDGYSLGAAVEGDNPISQDISSYQASVVAFLSENCRDYSDRIEAPQTVGEIDRTRVLATSVYSANCGDLATLIGLTKLAVIRKPLAYQGYGCAGVQKRSERARRGIFQANGAPCLDHVRRVHYQNVDTRTGIVLIKRIPRDFDAGHAMKRDRPVPSSTLA